MTLLTDTQIKVRRDQILSEMQSIREMIRGKISLQSLKRTAADGSVKERGPYAVFQRWLDGTRLPADLISRIKAPDDQPLTGEKCHPRRKLVIQSLPGPLTISRSYCSWPKPAR